MKVTVELSRLEQEHILTALALRVRTLQKNKSLGRVAEHVELGRKLSDLFEKDDADPGWFDRILEGVLGRIQK
jgi:hypothetical protein